MDPIRKRGSSDITPRRRAANTLDLSQAVPKKSAPKRPYTPEVKQPAALKPAAPNRRPQPEPEPAGAVEEPLQRNMAPALPEGLPGGRRRFWPAFWRFITLLIILGFIITGGIYIYVNFYTQQ